MQDLFANALSYVRLIRKGRGGGGEGGRGKGGGMYTCSSSDLILTWLNSRLIPRLNNFPGLMIRGGVGHDPLPHPLCARHWL